jgi:putative transposase
MKFFEINMLVALNLPNADTEIYRILHINQQGDHLVALPMPSVNKGKHQHRVPIRFQFQVMQAFLDQGQCRILLNDPWLAKVCHDDDLTAAQKSVLESNWKLISPLLEASKEELFDRVARGKIIQRVMQDHDKTKATIYRLLFQYWRGGQSKYALIPKYQNVGNRGQSRPARDSQPKRGRPRRTKQYLNAAPGINVTEKVKQKLVDMGRKFYEGKKYPLTKAYEEGLEDFFKMGERLEVDGSRTPVLPPEHELPTFAQFRYWYVQDRSLNFERAQKARLGEIEYNLTARPLSGESTSMAFGPGSVYQLDATIPAIYLVSSRDPQVIIGKPVVYGVSDVFSRMAVASWIGLEGPSWAGAIQALVNMVENKVDFCKGLGIEIDESDWPCHHLPEAILADRGEFEGYSASQLVNDFNVRVSNTAPYRADWKGIIERKFGHMDGTIINWLDGAVRLNRRGERDARLDATYTLQEFRHLLTLHFLEYNNTHEMEKYPRDADMKRDGLRPIPLHIWNWGLVNRSGSLKKVEPEALKIKLLPRDTATVTRRGVKFKNHYYTCAVIENEQWREKAPRQRSNRVSVACDTWKSGQIYVKHPKTHEFLLCHETNTVDATGDVPWAELDLETELDRLDRDEAAPVMNKKKRDFQNQQREVMRLAKARAKATKSTESKRSRLGSIQENRGIEKDLERKRLTNTEQVPANQGTLEALPHLENKMFADDVDDILANLSKANNED